MYEKRPRSPLNQKQPFSIRLNPIPVHEKVIYIDSVCAALNDSRFGPGRQWPMLTDLSSGPDRNPAVFCDMTVEGAVPSYTILSDSEMARRYSTLIIYEELERRRLAREANNANALRPSSQARGSPEISQGRSNSSSGSDANLDL